MFMTGGFIATLDVSDFIISSRSKIGNLIVQGKQLRVFMSTDSGSSSNITN